MSKHDACSPVVATIFHERMPLRHSIEDHVTSPTANHSYQTAMTLPNGGLVQPQTSEDPENSRSDLGDGDRTNAVETLADAAESSTAPLVSAVDQQSDRPSKAQIELFRKTWDFHSIINGLDKHTATAERNKGYLSRMFDDDKLFRAPTLTLFERWAALTDSDRRDDQMRDLAVLLYNRLGCRRGPGQSIGRNNEVKDLNIRADLTKLLRKWYPSEGFGGGEAHDDEEEAAGSSPRHSDDLLDGEEHSLDERSALITAISDNWVGSLTDIVPASAVPSNVRTSPINWPYEILKSLHKLSDITKSDDDDISEALEKDFEDTKVYNLKRTLQKLKAARASLGSVSDTESVAGATTNNSSNSKGKNKATQGSKAQPEPVTRDHGTTSIEDREDRDEVTSVRSSTTTGAGRQELQLSAPVKRPSSANLTASQSSHKKARTNATDITRPAEPAQPAQPSIPRTPSVPRTRTTKAGPLAAQSDSLTDTQTPAHENHIIRMPSRLSEGDKKRYCNLAFEIIRKDSDLNAAETEAKKSRARRSAAWLNHVFGAVGLAEMEVYDADIKVEGLRGELIGLRKSMFEIGGLVGSETEMVEWEIGKDGVGRHVS